MARFSQQLALVTGGASGIGQAIGRRLAREGARVVLIDKHRQALESSLQALREEGLAVSGRLLDISKEQKVKTALEEVVQKNGGQLHIMVNSAGIVGPTSTHITAYSCKDFEQVLAVNLTGAFLMTKYSLPYMLPYAYGRILHLASIGGKEGNPGMVGYAASKAGLMGLIKAVGKEYAQTGITVNGIAPAVIATPMNRDTAPAMLAYMTSKIHNWQARHGRGSSCPGLLDRFSRGQF